MWDIFFTLLLIATGVVLAIYQLRLWLQTKHWTHLLVIFLCVLSELAVIKGLAFGLIILVLAVVLWIFAGRGRSIP